MSPESVPEITAADLEFSRRWAENAARILEQLQGTAFVATAKPADDVASPEAGADEGEKLWINFKVSGKLAGELAFHFNTADGVRLAQMLTSEPVDAAVALNESHTDALNELFRQFAGVVTAACKARYGGSVEFELESALAPAWKPATEAAWVFAAPQIAPLQWTLLISAELHAALLAANQPNGQDAPIKPAQTPAAQGIASAPAQAPKAPSAQPSVSIPAAASSSSAPSPPPHVAVVAAKGSPTTAAGGNGSNLDLLLDVELDASLRFGQREMLLREILELRPGSVVELNRQLQEPAELLVGGRIIARGEVVIVDGNYGLRITHIVQPQKRLESLQT